MNRSVITATLATVLVAGVPSAAAAGPRLVAAFDDPAGDAYGPGSYVPPGDTEFEDGDFDLRRFAVLVDGDDVLLEVTLGARIRPPAITQRTNYTPLDLTNGIYFQNVDIYVDSDRTPGSGFSSCIPGRRVAFAGGRTWEHAVVLAPQPDAVRAVIDGAMGPAAARVFVATRIDARGRTLIAHVPISALGGVPRDDWGWSVQVSGARWEQELLLADRLRGREPDAFTMPVLPVRQAWAFGGAPSGDVHPRVVDVLLPPGVDQKAVLGSFDRASGAWARVPFVDAKAAAPAVASSAPVAAPPAAAPARPGLTVVDVSGDIVTLSGPVDGLVPLQIGRVLGADGEPVARVVVVRIIGEGLVANAVEGRERIVRGARVAFDAPAAPAPPPPGPPPPALAPRLPPPPASTP